MLAWIRSPRGSTATATAVAAVLALFWFAPWQKPLPFRLPFDTGVPVSPSAPGPQNVASGQDTPASALSQPATPQPVASQATGGKDPQAAGPAPLQRDAVAASPVPDAAAHEAAAPGPAFDVVRVEPNGDTVIAGRAAPGAEVLLQDGDKTLARIKVDETGQFALVPPTLAEGSHYLTLQMQGPTGPAVASVQGVAVTVAKAGATRPLVALLAPDKPAQILSDGAPIVAAPAAADVAGMTPVAIQAVEAAEGGRFTASGVARAGSQCRVYLNGAFLADVTAGKDGRWSVEIQKGMKPGRYTVRADELEAASGKVLHRAEVPFTYPERLAGGARRALMAQAQTGAGDSTGPDAGRTVVASTDAAGQPIELASKPDAGTQVVVANLNTATVLRGDSLWRISRRMLGHGVKYTEIYASNATQIRNPKLIYPGQVFVVPNAHAD